MYADSVPCFLLLARRDGGVGVWVSSVGVPRSASSAGMLPTLLDDRKKNALVLQRGALLRGALLCALCLAMVVGGILAAGWEIQLLRASTAQAQRSALVAAHHSSVQLVSRTLSLQSELDMQEDHDRAVLQLYLQLEREALPHLLQQLTTATAGCSDEARQRVSDATTSLRREMHAHSTQMLDKLQKALSTPCARCPAAPTDPWSLLVQVAARARARANELAADVAKQARADRQRLRAQAAAGEAAWSDEELEAPLSALLRALQRPNATFALAPEVSHEPRGGGQGRRCNPVCPDCNPTWPHCSPTWPHCSPTVNTLQPDVTPGDPRVGEGGGGGGARGRGGRRAQDPDAAAGAGGVALARARTRTSFLSLPPWPAPHQHSRPRPHASPLWPHHAAEALPLGRRRRGRSASSSCMPPRIRAPLSSSYCR